MSVKKGVCDIKKAIYINTNKLKNRLLSGMSVSFWVLKRGQGVNISYIGFNLPSLRLILPEKLQFITIFWVSVAILICQPLSVDSTQCFW